MRLPAPRPTAPAHRLLVVIEDDAALRATLAEWLRSWQFAVLAIDPARSLSIEGAHLAADAIIADFDLGLPSRSGLDMALGIARRVGHAIPTLVLSDSYGKREIAACSAHQIPVLFKPLQARELQFWLHRAVPSVSIDR